MATINKRLGPYDYKLNSEKESPAATVFIVQPLNGLDYLFCWQEVTKVDNKFRISADGMHRAIGAGLRGWRNLRDHLGNDAPFSPDAIELLDSKVINELVWEILTNAQLSEAEVKN